MCVHRATAAIEAHWLRTRQPPDKRRSVTDRCHARFWPDAVGCCEHVAEYLKWRITSAHREAADRR